MLNIQKNITTYGKIKKANTEEDRISSSYLKKQVQTIYKLKRYIRFWTFIEKKKADLGIRNNENRHKIIEYIKLVSELEDNFSAIIREIAFTMVYDKESFLKGYIEKGITEEQLEKIKMWDLLESKERWWKEHGEGRKELAPKKLEKSMASIYHSFL